MTRRSSAEVRRAFLEFFEKRGHQLVPSSPLVPQNDPTLMFANAGMVQFKDVFVGKETRGYTRATSSQKCIRISGKHNDLENVGVTARHHTFFEMLGNFSFGDYFKEDAIAFAWELLTKEFALDPRRMMVTVFGGEGGVPADDEARAIWRKVTGFGDDRILGLGAADNFWQMGETGPCGPCTEVHWYNGDVVDGAPPYETFGQEPTPTGLGWMEIWNVVFMQFDRSLGAAGKASTSRRSPSPASTRAPGSSAWRACSRASRATTRPTCFDHSSRRRARSAASDTAARRRTTTSPCASSPTTRGPPRSWSQRASSPTGRAASTSSGA